jgi:hypothetical protein
MARGLLAQIAADETIEVAHASVLPQSIQIDFTDSTPLMVVKLKWIAISKSAAGSSRGNCNDRLI